MHKRRYNLISYPGKCKNMYQSEGGSTGEITLVG